MNEQVREQWLQDVATSFRYPPTPDVAGDVRRRLSRPRVAPKTRPLRLAWAVLAFLLLAAALLAVPGVRAAVLEFLQIGAIRILPQEATATPAQTTTGRAEGDVAAPATGVTTPDRPGATRTLLDIAGATTWEAAQGTAGFPLQLPAYPPALGQPDEVYEQQLWDPDLQEPVFILVWREPQQPEEVRLALYEIAWPYYGLKSASLEAITQTRVNGAEAFWVRGPHRLQLAGGEVEEWLFVAGNVLIWTEGEITYRLEGAATVEEAVRIAESLQPG